MIYNIEDCEPKWVNPVLNITGVNSLRLGSLQLFIVCSIVKNRYPLNTQLYYSLVPVDVEVEVECDDGMITAIEQEEEVVLTWNNGEVSTILYRYN